MAFLNDFGWLFWVRIRNPSISDKDLELHLHKQLAEIERQLLVKGHEIMNPQTEENVEEYQERLNEYLKTAEDIKKSDLAIQT